MLCQYSDANLEFVKAEGFTSMQLRLDPDRLDDNAIAAMKDKIAKKELAVVYADTLPTQIDQMKEGLSQGQVGQRPFEMGYKTMMALKDIKYGKPGPQDPTYTGLDVCTPDNADTCIAK